MRWYWEPGHYKSALGEHILERIIHGRTHFGRVLTAANIESALAEIREERDRFSRLLRGPASPGREPGGVQARGRDPPCLPARVNPPITLRKRQSPYSAAALSWVSLRRISGDRSLHLALDRGQRVRPHAVRVRIVRRP